MDITNIISAIKMEFDPSGMPGLGEIREAINETIRDLNNGLPLQRVLLTITGGGETIWGDVTANWGDVTIDWGDDDFIHDFSYDSTNYILTIPDSIIKIDDIYIDDVKQIPMAYSRMLNSYSEVEDWVYLTYGEHYNIPANGYTCIGNTIHFNDDVTGVMKVVVYKSYDELDGNTLIVPSYFHQFLISNSVTILGMREKNIIGSLSLKEHITKSEKALIGVRQRLINSEHTDGLDAW